MTSPISSTPITLNRLKTEQLALPAQAAPKAAMRAGDIVPAISRQVAGAALQSGVAPMGEQAFLALVDTSQFSQAESQAVAKLFVANLDNEERAQLGSLAESPVSALPALDLSKLEKNIGVLMAAIVALNVARQASAQMSGTFVQMAFESAKAAGAAIVSAGQASMWASVSGGVLASSMAIGGAGLSIKGQKQKHDSLTLNKKEGMKLGSLAADIRSELKTAKASSGSPGVERARGTNANGELETQRLNNGNGLSTPREREVVKAQAVDLERRKADMDMAHELSERTFKRNETVGGAVSSMAHVTSTSVSSIVRLEESRQRQQETLAQAEQGVSKSAHEAANQVTSENSALLNKILEAMMQLVSGRASTISAMASQRV